MGLAALTLAGCKIQFDFDDVRGADLTYIDADGTWWIIGDPDPLWTQPDDGFMIPVPADYDGDGVDEPAVFRQSTGEWIVASAGIVAVLGERGDVPIAADLDGDGTDDRAAYRPLTGEWLVEGRDVVIVDQLAVVLTGDLDGDGIDDVVLTH